MSQRHAVQDATGIVAADENGDSLIIVSDGEPSSVEGYAKGALAIDVTSGVDYVLNAGTARQVVTTTS